MESRRISKVEKVGERSHHDRNRSELFLVKSYDLVVDVLGLVGCDTIERVVAIHIVIPQDNGGVRL
jgi:hypothetical protein